MKKKVFSIIGVAAFAVAVAVNMNVSVKNNESDLVLANVKALAKKVEIDFGKGCVHDPRGKYTWYPEDYTINGLWL